jgi:serine/threonine protein kinase
MIPGFDLIDRIGESASSQLFRARRSSDTRMVILRVPRDETLQDRARLRREFEFLKQQRLPGLVIPLLFCDTTQPAIVLRHNPGRLLSLLMDESRLDLRASLIITRNLARTLSGLHNASIIYRDLQPANILLSPDDWSTCIIDCSVCSGAISSEASEREWAYIAPEQTGLLRDVVDHRADLYSLGVLLYRMMTGRLPFEASDPLDWAHSHIARAPVSPSQITGQLPPVLSELVLKLLAKAPEDRYQSAHGLEHDLAECITRLETTGTIPPFELGSHDISRHFRPSRKLYGRAAESAEVFAGFKRVAHEGRPEIVLVSGEAGIGKSSLVHHVQQSILKEGGRFIEGKFDEHKREVPFSTLTEAFRNLVDQLLTESDARIAAWREQIQHAVGENGRLMLEVIPQLALIIGPQPPVPEVPPDAAQNRFRRVFRSFIGVFTKRDHPLVLFLDDVQWVDSASLALAAQLMTPCDSCYLLLLGANRDNEVPETHPMHSVLASLRNAGTRVTQVWLPPPAATGVEPVSRR